MKKLVFGAVFLILASAPAFADVQMTMQNGRVTILAKDATVRQILNEWSKIGKTNIVNVERVPGGPMTLELRDVTEGQALEVLLRSLSGYITAPRAEQTANLSQFDRIIIMPTVASVRPTSSAPPPPVFQQQQAPQFQQTPMMTPPPADDDVDDERPAPNVQIPNVPPQPGRSPAFNAVPMQAPTTAPQGTYPGMPPGGMPVVGGVPATNQQPPATSVSPFGGVAVPGMIVAPPQQPGQQGQPGQVQPGQVQQPVQPGQPVRRPGGEN